jgi:F-type H+-transporting ATPase subunit epsilon
MARTLMCEVVTPERIVYRNEVELVIAPASDGEIGILPLHAPLVTLLKPGEIRVRYNDGNDTEWIATSGGYLQVHEDKVIVLADRAEIASRIDVERARAETDSIEERMGRLPVNDPERSALEADLGWHVAQITVAGKVT